MELIEQFTELESLLPTIDDLIKHSGFRINDTEEDIWRHIMLELKCSINVNRNLPSLRQKVLFEELAKKDDCSILNYANSYIKTLDFWREDPKIDVYLRAMVVIFESRLQRVYKEYSELHNAKVTFWRQCFDKVIESAKTITAGEQDWVTEEFIRHFELDNGLIKYVSSYSSMYLELVDNLPEQDIISYVSWCWKYYQKKKEMEEELSRIKHNPPHNNCFIL